MPLSLTTPPRSRAWAAPLLVVLVGLVSGAAFAQDAGPHEAAMDWFMGLGSVASLGLALLGGWYGLREKHRREREHENAPVLALQQQSDRYAAALGLREDDTPLRDRVGALEERLAAVEARLSAIQTTVERVEANGDRVLAALTAGRT